jgi:hypothetical protein
MFRQSVQRRSTHQSHPCLERLEERCLLTTVTNLNDAGPGSLRQAIADTPIAGTVDFMQGLSGTITLTSGTLTINKILTITGPGASIITVSGNKAQQVFSIPSPFTVAISGLTIAKGGISYSPGGAGISNGGALTLTGCILSDNSIGAGIYNTGNLTVISCTFSGNSGGGIFNGGALTVTSCAFSGNSGGSIYNSSVLTVTSCTFSGNTGDGISNSSGRNVTIANCTFSQNNGDGIDHGGNGTLTITDSSFNSNSGDGIFNSGTMTVTNSTLSGNSNGGISSSGTLTITNSTISGNSAGNDSGGGISNGGGTLKVTSCTFSANSSSGNGGGIFDSGGDVTIATSTFNLNAAVTGAGIFDTSSGTLSIISSTLNGNYASSQGGGIIHSGSGKVTTRNSILAGNSAPSSPDVMGVLNSQGYDLIGDGAGGSGFLGTDLIGTMASPIDPQLGMLQDNGGPTFTMALLPGSPALNAGDPVQLGQPDQRGVVRSGSVNIGAYQASASSFAVGAPAQANAGVPFDLTVMAVDVFDQEAIGYTGTVHFTSSDGQAVLPPDALPSNGTGSFSVTLNTAGMQTVTATDLSSGVTASATITVTSSVPAVDHFNLSAPASVTAGSPFEVTVAAVDGNGNVVPAYSGTVSFSSTDPYPGVLPANYTFTSSDEGVHTFTGGVALFTAGTQTLTVYDTTTSSVSGSATITVSPSSASSLLLAAPATAVAGTAFNVTVTALDAYGNVATGYTGTVLLTSSDRNPQLSNYTFTPSDNGTHSLALTLLTAGVQTVLARDAANGFLAGTTTVTVQAATPFDFLMTAPSSVVAGTPFDVIIAVLDIYGNTATDYNGTVHFTTSDSGAGVILPADYTFTTGSGGDNGVHDFPADFTLVTSGLQNLSATDSANSLLGGTQVFVDPSPVPPAPGGGAVPPPDGGGARPPNPSMASDPTPAAGVRLAPQIAVVDRFFSLLDPENSSSVPHLLKRHRQGEETGWQLGLLHPEWPG